MPDIEKLLALVNDFTEHVPHEEGQTWEEAFADHLIANGVTVQHWIPVTERLPRCGERVLITDGKAVFEASLSISHKWVRCGIGWAENVTHWMPIIEPPKGE